MIALQEAYINKKALETEDYFDDFAAAIARCDAVAGSNPKMAYEQQVVLSEYAEGFLKTSESYLRSEPQYNSSEGDPYFLAPFNPAAPILLLVA